MYYYFYVDSHYWVRFLTPDLKQNKCINKQDSRQIEILKMLQITRITADSPEGSCELVKWSQVSQEW